MRPQDLKTKEQRLKFYENLLSDFESSSPNCFCFLMDEKYSLHLDPMEFEKVLPELYTQKPKRFWRLGGRNGWVTAFWWKPWSKVPRKKALKAAIALCKSTKMELDTDQIIVDGGDMFEGTREQDEIIVDGGDMFEGTREQFANCFFSNADNEQIIDWCKQNSWTLSINGKIILNNNELN